MIVEYIRYAIPAERQAEFVAAYSEAATDLTASPHCQAYELSRCHEQPDQFMLRIEWDSLAGHTQGFRSSSEFQRFFAKIKPFFEQIQEMRHYAVTEVVARKSAAAMAPAFDEQPKENDR